MKEFPALDILNLPSDATILFEVDYPMFEDKKNKIIRFKNYLLFWTEYTSKFTGKKKISQSEFPIKSIWWFVETIENRYWGNQGDKTTISEQNTFNGEQIGISSMIHCCSENLPGYNFWNKSRKSHISGVAPQSWHIPKYMLKEGLLDQLKSVS